jgi:large subunit ribosomal protein L21
LTIFFVGRTNIYAIVETGGKQYRVSPGETIDVDNLNTIDGQTIDLDRVLLINDNGKTTIGKPVIEGAKVNATSHGTVRGAKVIVYKFKAKVRYRRKVGHHQLFTRLTIDSIAASGSESESMKKGSPSEKEEAVSGT